MISIKLYGFKKPQNTPSPSGYCQKVETFIRATGNADKCTLVPTLPIGSPKGKLPYIELEKDGKTEKIADSHFIIKKLVEEKVAQDLDADLNATEKGDSRAWQVWTEELIFPATGYTRWGYKANYATAKKDIPLPAFLRPLAGIIIRRRVLKGFYAAGVGRHSSQEIESILSDYVFALNARLEHTYFLGKSEPTQIDVILYSFLISCLGCPANPEYNTLVLASERLKKYIAFLTKKWFPEYESILKMVET